MEDEGETLCNVKTAIFLSDLSTRLMLLGKALLLERLQGAHRLPTMKSGAGPGISLRYYEHDPQRTFIIK